MSKLYENITKLLCSTEEDVKVAIILSYKLSDEEFQKLLKWKFQKDSPAQGLMNFFKRAGSIYFLGYHSICEAGSSKEFVNWKDLTPENYERKST